MYDRNKETIVAADSSLNALGVAVFQVQDNGHKRPVAYASRALTPTEKRYAIIELEALAICYGVEKFENLLLGKYFHIQTDHKPLVSLLGKKDISDLPARIQRFRLRLMRFDFSISHVPGKLC